MATTCNTLNAFNKDTARNFELDAGILVKDVTDPSKFDYTGGVKLGATSGGTSASFTNEIRNLFDDVDGARGKYMGGDIIDMQDGVLTFTLLEQTAENIKLALGSADISDITEGGKMITPRSCIKDTDYMKNLCWFGTIKGSDKPMVIELRNALNETGFTFTAEDKSKGTVECEVHSRKDLSKPDEASFVIYLPPLTTVTV